MISPKYFAIKFYNNLMTDHPVGNMIFDSSINDICRYILDVVTLSGILKAKQKLGVTFDFDKQDVIDLMKFLKMTMCRASEANSEK